MNTRTHLRNYLVQFVLEWEIYQTKVVVKIKTRALCSVPFFFSKKKFLSWENVEKYDRTRHATNDHRPRRMRIAYWIRKAADTY
jgi:hypothetical protein